MNQDSLHRLEVALEAAGAVHTYAATLLVDTHKITVDKNGFASNEDIIKAVKTTMQCEPWAFAEVNESVLGKFKTMDSFVETLSDALNQSVVPKESA